MFGFCLWRSCHVCQEGGASGNADQAASAQWQSGIHGVPRAPRTVVDESRTMLSHDYDATQETLVVSLAHAVLTSG